jgi:hypothetical protein
LGNPSNLALSVLLKQGRGEEIGVISIPAPRDVPNNGLYVWNVANTLPPGDDYYIRLQTGTSDDWNGGLDASPPTSGGVYGTTGYFSINYTTAAATTAFVISTQFITCCGDSSNSNAGVIAGSVIGGVIGLALLLGTLGYAFMPTVTIQIFCMFYLVLKLIFSGTTSWGRRISHLWLLVPIATATGIAREGRLRSCSSNCICTMPNLLSNHLSQLTLTLVPEGLSTDKAEVVAWQVIVANYSKA